MRTGGWHAGDARSVARADVGAPYGARQKRPSRTKTCAPGDALIILNEEIKIIVAG
jgi:hypothetical protein